MKREIAEGHEVANHSYSHPLTLTKLNSKNILSQIDKTNDVIEKAIGMRPKLVRAPGGSVNKTIKEIVKFPLIHWSVDTRDWQTKSTQSTIDAVLKNAADGDIILMHDIYSSTANAADTIFKELANRKIFS